MADAVNGLNASRIIRRREARGAFINVNFSSHLGVIEKGNKVKLLIGHSPSLDGFPLYGTPSASLSLSVDVLLGE
jgi:hypothetical protein